MSSSPQSAQSELLAKRWCEERVRLKLTQGQLGEALGVSRTSATMYEAGKQMPGAEVLMRLGEIGADILYILTGQRAKTSTLDVDRLEAALEEVRRQTFVSNEQLSQRQLLDRANTIYQAVANIGNVAPKVVSDEGDRKRSPVRISKNRAVKPQALSQT